MRKYQKTRHDKALAFDEAMEFLEGFLKGHLDNGVTKEQGEQQFWATITPPETYNQEQTQPTNAATDSTVSPCSQHLGRDCPEFGKKFHKDSDPCQQTCPVKDDCHGAWVHELFKSPRQKELERNVKIYALIEKNKEILRKSDLQDLIRVGAMMREVEEKREAQIDTLTKKYMDRDPTIPEKTARESAVWEQKQIDNARQRESMKRQHDWDLLSKDEQDAYKMQIMKDNKKMLRGENIE